MPIIDHRGENCPYPYVQVGLARTEDDFSTKCHAGVELKAQIDVWTRYKGSYQANFIAGQVLKLITKEALDMSADGIEEVHHMIAEDEIFKETDGTTVRRMIRIRFKLQDLVTIQN